MTSGSSRTGSSLSSSRSNRRARFLPIIAVLRRPPPLCSRYSLHDAPHPSREAAPPALLGDLLHALRYLLGRGVWSQFHTHFAHSRRQVDVGLAPAAEAGPVQALAWEMALRANGH